MKARVPLLARENMQNSTSGAAQAFRFAWGQSQGRRARQEDSCLTVPDMPATKGSEQRQVLIALADGMGGHVSGQVASQTVCRSFVGAFRSQDGNIGARLASALGACNEALAHAIAEDAALAGMGSTLVAAHVDAEGVRWASVGDSTLMLYRDGILQRLNADHSHGAILDQQAAAGIISEEIARSDVRRRALHSALTGQPVPLQDLELEGQALEPGDWVIVASDGLLTLGGDDIATLIHDHADGPPDALVKALLEAVEAEQEPNQDNTTIAAVLVVAVAEGAEAQADAEPSGPPTVQPASEALPTTRILERRDKAPPAEREIGRASQAKVRAGTGNSMTMTMIVVAAAVLAGAVWMLAGS